MTQFEVGKYYGLMEDGKTKQLMFMLGRTPKTVSMFRYADYGYGGTGYTADASGERRYKVKIDEDGDEYTIIDRFTNMRNEVWGTKVSSNPDKADAMVMLGHKAYDGHGPIWQEHA